MSSLHAPVAAAALQSLFRLGIQPLAVAHSMLGVISQRLIRTLCPDCKEPHTLPLERPFEGVRHLLEPGEADRLFAPRGCPECFGTGYRGRTGIFELLAVTPHLREMIGAGASVSQLRCAAVEQGMVEFRQAARYLLGQGVTSLEEILRVFPYEYLAPSR
jgi:type II secretory ATPase GspE/PulE/Tfp pilus assembly ATPase PilB-like protein